MLLPREPVTFLDPNEWLPLPLVEKETITHNTRRFRCVLRPLLGRDEGRTVIHPGSLSSPRQVRPA